MKVSFSVSSQSILKGLSRNFVTNIILFREIPSSILKVRPYDLTCNAILRINRNERLWAYVI